MGQIKVEKNVGVRAFVSSALPFMVMQEDTSWRPGIRTT